MAGMGENYFTQLFAPVSPYIWGVCFTLLCFQNALAQGTELSLAPTSLSFPQQGDTLTLDITSNSQWSFQNTSSRIFVDPSLGNGNAQVRVWVSANPSVQRYEDSLSVTAGELSRVLPISQDPAPCVPTSADSLLARKVSPTEVFVSWPNQEGGMGYALRYRRLGEAESWTEVDTLTQAQLELSGLADATVYEWEVRVQCGNLFSAWVRNTFKTEEFCPTPQMGEAVPGADSSAALFWDVNSTSTSFQVRYREQGDTSWIETPLIGRIDTLLEGLTVNVVYEWELRSFCQESFSNWTDTDTFFIFSCGTPQELAVDSLSDSTVFLSWRAGANNQQYRLRYRPISSDNPWVLVENIPGASFQLGDLLPDSSYEWELMGVCAEDSSDWIAGESFTTTGPPFIEIVNLSDSVKVGIPFSVEFLVRNWDIQPNGRQVRYLLNGVDLGPFFTLEPIEIDSLPMGFQSIRLELAEADGSLVGSSDSVFLEVVDNPSISLAPPFLFFPFQGDTLQAFIFSDISWEILSTKPWVHVSPIRGTTNDTLQIWVDPNSSFDELSDTLRVVAGSSVDSLILFQTRTDCFPVLNPRTSNIQDTGVSLGWTPNNQSSGFEVRYQEEDSLGTWILIDSLTQASVDLRGLAAGTTYIWQVRNKCGAFRSDWTDTVRFQTMIACLPLTNLQVDTVSNTWGVVNWEGNPSASSYFVRYRSQGEPNWMTPLSLEDTFARLEPLALGQVYEWQARSSCEGTFSDWIDGPDFGTRFQVGGCGVPLGLASENITDSSASLRWAPVDSAMAYQVRYRLTSADLWVDTVQLLRNVTEQAGLRPSSSYEWQVRTLCADSTTEWSASETFQTLRDPNFSCEPPQDLQVIYIADSTLRFIWTPVPEALFYQLRYSLQSDSFWVTLGPLEGTEVNVEGLLPDSSYQVEVRGICAISETGTEWGATQQFNIPGPNSQCAQPTNLSGTVLGEQSLSFEWGPENLITFFRLRYRPLGASSWVIQDSILRNTQVLSDLLPGTPYEWAVGSLCDTTVSLWTEGPTLSTWKAPTINLLTPEDSTSINEGESLRFQVSAQDDDGFISSIRFYSNGSLLEEVSADSSSFTWVNVPRGYYQVFAIAIDNNGLTQISDTLTVIVGLDPQNIILGEFEVSRNQACEVDTDGLLITDLSVGASSYSWSFGAGAIPPTSGEEGPHTVIYTSSGVKTIQLVVENERGGVDSVEQQIDVFINPPKPFAGNDTTICLGGYTMRASEVEDGMGRWEVLSGNAIIDSINSPNTTVRGLRLGTNVFTWRAISGDCESEADTVILTRISCAPEAPTEIFGPDTLCIGEDPSSFVFSVTPDTSVDAFIWVTPPGIMGRPDTESNTLLIESFSGAGGTIQVLAENEIGRSEPVTKFILIDSCLAVATPGNFELKGFLAFLKGDQVILDWVVGFDQGIQSYVIEKSLDSIIFESIETLPANQLGLEEIKYRSIDPSPIEGKVFYRLKITDSQGGISFSEVIALELGGNVPPGNVSVSPNPLTARTIEISIQAIQAEDILVQVTSSSGAKMYKRILGVAAGFNSIEIDAIGWPRGIFYVSILLFDSDVEFGFKIQKESLD